MQKLIFILSVTGLLFFVASCNRVPRDPEKARLRALSVAQNVFKNDARKVIKITEYLPYSESGCVSYGNNGRYMVILRGNGLSPQGKKTSFRASLDVDMTGMRRKIHSILLDLQTTGSPGE